MTGPRRRDPDQTGDTPTKLSLAPPVMLSVLFVVCGCSPCLPIRASVRLEHRLLFGIPQ
jgi:hypothetical protein